MSCPFVSLSFFQDRLFGTQLTFDDVFSYIMSVSCLGSYGLGAKTTKMVGCVVCCLFCVCHVLFHDASLPLCQGCVIGCCAMV